MKHGSNVRFVTQSDLPGNATERDMPYERTGRMGAQKYLKESCYHHIKCYVANFLTVLMWRKPLNSVALAISTHRRLEGVFDEIDTQVVA